MNMLAITDLLRPISQAQPAGAPNPEAQRFHRLRTEVVKLDSVLEEAVDWNEVFDCSAAVLQDVCKDFLVASYCGAAAFEQHGISGLAWGLQLLAHLIDAYWETGYPTVARLRGRTNAIAWLTNYATRRLAMVVSEPHDPAAVGELIGSYEQLSQAVASHWQASPPPLRDLQAAISRLTLASQAAPLAEAVVSIEVADTNAKDKASAIPNDLGRASAGIVPSDEQTLAASSDAQSKRQDSPLELLLAPICETSPAGADPRYTPEAEAARSEVAKRELPTGGEIDWQRVETCARTVLTQSGKDLTCASYLAYCFYRSSGLDGLLQGFLLLYGLVDRYWDTMFPAPRRGSYRGRANAISWLLAIVEVELAAFEPVAKDADRLDLLEIQTHSLGKVMQAAFGQETPALGGVLSAIQRARLNVPPPPVDSEAKAVASPMPVASTPSNPRATAGAVAAPAQEAAAPKPQNLPADAQTITTSSAPAPSPAASELSVPTTIGSAEGVPAYLIKLGQGMLTAAALLRKSNPLDATCYRLARQGAWLHLMSAPPMQADGQTSLPPLPEDRRRQLELLFQHEKWSTLLEEAETCFPRSRLCLDLQYWIHRALREQGPTGIAAAQAVAAQVSELLRRFPELVAARANDGSPLANEATRNWLSDLLSPPGPQAQVTSRVPTSAGWLQSIEEQTKLSGDELIEHALAQVDIETDPREAASRRVELANRLLDVSPKLAHLLLGSVAQELSGQLRHWDRKLTADTYESLIVCRRKLAKQVPTNGQHAAVIDESNDLQVLASLDLARAQRLLASA